MIFCTKLSFKFVKWNKWIMWNMHISKIKSSKDAESTHWFWNKREKKKKAAARATTATDDVHITFYPRIKSQVCRIQNNREKEYMIQTVSMNVLYIQHCSTLSTCFLFWFSFNVLFFSSLIQAYTYSKPGLYHRSNVVCIV